MFCIVQAPTLWTDGLHKLRIQLLEERFVYSAHDLHNVFVVVFDFLAIRSAVDNLLGSTTNAHDLLDAVSREVLDEQFELSCEEEAVEVGVDVQRLFQQRTDRVSCFDSSHDFTETAIVQEIFPPVDEQRFLFPSLPWIDLSLACNNLPLPLCLEENTSIDGVRLIEGERLQRFLESLNIDCLLFPEISLRDIFIRAAHRQERTVRRQDDDFSEGHLQALGVVVLNRLLQQMQGPGIHPGIWLATPMFLEALAVQQRTH